VLFAIDSSGEALARSQSERASRHIDVGTAPAVARDVPRLIVSTDAWRAQRPGGGTIGQRWLDPDGVLIATGGRDGGTWWMNWAGLATYVFGPIGPVTAYVEPGASLVTLHDSFTRGVLPVVMAAREHEAFHASGIATSNGIVALCAPSGAGKSTLAFALATRGFQHWADDAIVLDADDDAPHAIAMPFPARVDAEARARISGRVSVAAPGTRAPLRTIYFLRRDAALNVAVPVIMPIEGPARFERLLAHVHPFELSAADRTRRMVERLLRVARRTAMYELRFAPSLTHLPVLAARAVEHIASA
jgi:hypothetical protein